MWPKLNIMSGHEKPKEVATPNAEAKVQFEQLASAARRKAFRSVAKLQKLIDNLHGDLEKQGDATLWKRYGDLLLANVSNAVRSGDIVLVTDYFDDAASTIEIDGDANKTISEIAESYFRRYTKARNGLRVITGRLAIAEKEIRVAKAKLTQIDAAIETSDTEFLSSLIEQKQKPAPVGRKKKIEAAFKGARKFVSSDGFEILIGKKAKDNDYLTFRIAKSLDMWMHAADYPGSHVIVRIPNRKEMPNQTLLEAAQLAAFYSSGRKQPKAAVHYTQKKFVNKPRRAAPGLVSLASFKTILVEPQVPVLVTSNTVGK